MSRPHRIVSGSGIAGYESGAHFTLAITLIDHAHALGCTDVSLAASRERASASRYIRFTDVLGQVWRVRVSNHHKPRLSGPAYVHFDFISADGVSGLDEARDYLTELAEGRVDWFDPRDQEKRPRGPRLRRRRHR